MSFHDAEKNFEKHEAVADAMGNINTRFINICDNDKDPPRKHVIDADGHERFHYIASVEELNEIVTYIAQLQIISFLFATNKIAPKYIFQ